MVGSGDKGGSGSGGALSVADVQALLKDPSAENRAVTAAKVAGQLSAASFSATELPMAQEILRVMARDAERRVREALAREARSAKDLPHDVAILLAKDVESVAMPVLEFSDVLREEDLIEIASAADEMKQTAIARRGNVSEALAETLIDKGNQTVVETLVRNEGASISESGFEKAIERFGEDENIQDGLVHRQKLPVGISERLVSIVSDRLREHLVKHHDLPANTATDLLLEARENATLSLVSNGAPSQKVEDLVAELHRNGRLTESIVLRAACLGDMDFAQAAMAELASVPLINAQKLFDDSGALGLKALFDRTGLPKRSYPVLRKALDVMRDTDYDGLENDRERFSLKVLERLLTAFETDDFGLSDDDVEYLMKRLSALTSKTAETREHLH
ncbi:DUF2336 domain-containing protein [Nisaea sediminum]|uniref:DUF2336 domain-containing protein n=1 Tax=Nisaea sediminum TaxID=2775867 RepID=UPI001869486A|nr:DUF2336 domain-containing protein [Nisaea sediminum]